MRVIGTGNDHANVDAVGVPGAGAAVGVAAGVPGAPHAEDAAGVPGAAVGVAAGVPGAAIGVAGTAVGVAAILLAAIIAKSSSSESSHAGRMFDIGSNRMRMV